VWKIHLLWQVLIKLPCIGKDKESESHDVHRRTEGAGMVHFLGAVSRFHVKPRRVAEGPLLCLGTWVTVLCQDIGDTSMGSGGDTCGLRLSGELR